MLKKLSFIGIFAFISSIAFNSLALPNLTCYYKMVNGEPKVTKCCDEDGVCEPM